jgi:hypothetical protein
MCRTYKRLKGKEMALAQGNIMQQVLQPERDSKGRRRREKEVERNPEFGDLVGQ